MDFPGPTQQEKDRSLPKIIMVKKVSYANGSPPGTDHETFVMIVDGAWRSGSQAAATTWVVYDSIGMR